jgi:hypothetical protein
MVNPLIYTSPSGVTSYINPMTYNSDNAESWTTGGASQTQSLTKLTNLGVTYTPAPSGYSSGGGGYSYGGYSYGGSTYGGGSEPYSGASSDLWMTGYNSIPFYDEGGISTGPSIAGVSMNSRPEIHLTKDNVQEFLGLNMNNSPMIIQLVLDGKVLQEATIGAGINNARNQKLTGRR